MTKEEVEITISLYGICNKQLGVFYVFMRSGLLPAIREGTDLGENFYRHMVQPRQTLCCGIWQHTGTSGCLATSSLALRPGTDTWYPVGSGLHHLCQLSLKAHTELMSPKFYSQHCLSFCFHTQILYSQRVNWMLFLSLLHHCSRSARFHVCAIPRPTVRTLVFDAPGTRKLPVYSVGVETLGTDKASLSFLKARGMQSVREDFHRPSGNNKMILQKQNDVIHHVGTEMFVVFFYDNKKASFAK